MEVVQEKIVIRPDRSRLADVRQVVRKICLENGVEPRTTQRLVLAMDEAISNIMEHSQSDQDDMIQICLEINENEIVSEIKDQGIPFDPCQYVKVVRPKGTENNKPFKRGFGLYLIHLITDEIAYCRTDDN